MRKLLVALGQTATLCLAGCIIAGDEKVERPADKQTIQEIDAAKKLDWDSQRKRLYQRIAMREALSDGGQVYLVKAVFGNLQLDAAKQDVLLTLIMNPAFSRPAERAILKRIGWMRMPTSRQRILEAMRVRQSAR